MRPVDEQTYKIAVCFDYNDPFIWQQLALIIELFNVNFCDVSQAIRSCHSQARIHLSNC